MLKSFLAVASLLAVAAANPLAARATPRSDIDMYLKGHNTVRAQHGAAALTFYENFASKVRQWANGCVFKHSGGTLRPYGENFATGTGDYFIAAAIKSWADEVSSYDPQPSHFTLVV